MYRGLFRAIYRTTDEVLGFPTAGPSVLAEAADLLTQMATAKAVGPRAAAAYATQVDTIRVLDRQLGAPTALVQLRAVTQSIEQLLCHALMPSAREPLAAVLADAATLAGWQALDLGDVKQAWSLHETAKAAAREAGDAPALAHAMGQQAYVLLDAGASTDAVQLVQAAQQPSRSYPPVLSAWLSAAEAEACAAIHDDAGSRTALDNAASVLPSGDGLLALPYLVLDEAHLARWRGNVLARLGDDEATTDLYRALAEMDPTFTRAQASLECDLAQAHIKRGELAEARRHVARARQLARQTGSIRQRRRIDALSFAA
jgi:tetratricopeptide (TPR) repeat protein